MKKLFFVYALVCLSGYVRSGNPDGCLRLLPLIQSQGKNVADQSADSVGIIGLLKDWNRQQPTAEEQKRLAEKIDGDISQALFLYCLQDSVTKQPPFSEIHTLVGQSGIPVRAMTGHNLALTVFLQQKDLQGSIEAVRRVTRTDLSAATMQDWFVFGKVLNFILAEADLSQSKVMFRLLDELAGEEERQELLTLKKLRDNFEGKIMLIEMGEE